MDNINKIYDNLVKHNQIHLWHSYNIYNSINPHFDKELNINGHRKFYLNNLPVLSLTTYEPYYPENFFNFWELINKYKVINVNYNNFGFLDDGKSQIPQGYVEATIKFCENNYVYELNKYVRITTSITTLKKHDEKFNTTYSNQTLCEFPILNKKSIYNYFSNNKFDFTIGTMPRLFDNLTLLLISKINSNSIIVINNIFDDYEENNKVIDLLTKLYNKVIITRPIVQHGLNPTAYLILLGQKEFGQTEIDIILSNVFEHANIKDYLFKIKCDIQENIINIQKYICEYYVNKGLNNDLTKAIEWTNKYNLDVKFIYKKDMNVEKIISFDQEYIKLKLTHRNINNLIKFKKIEETKIMEPQPELHNVKRKLNNYKRLIDTKEQFIDNDLDKNIIDWNKLTDCIDLLKNLKRIVAWKFNAEIVNNSWTKFYEILSREDLVNNLNTLKTFHINDVNCSSISALNHFVNTKTNIKNFNWYTNQKDNVLFNIYPYKFLLGKNVSGDITNLSNIMQYKKDNRLNNLDLIICDGSLKIPINKFNEQESYVSRLVFAEILTLLNLLPTDGSGIIKIYLPLCESFTISMLFLLTHLFQDISIVKPTASHPSSSEVYCILKKYIGLYKIPKNIYDNLIFLYNNDKYDIFNLEQIDKDFIKEIVNISTNLCNRQIKSIQRSINLRYVYYDNIDVQTEISSMREEIINKWLQDTKITKLPHENALFKKN